MSWKELNWFKFEGSVFLEEVKGTFSTIFALTEDEFQKSRKNRDSDISKQTDNKYRHEELAWSEERLHKESQILTAMILTVTYRAIQNFLNELLSWHTDQNPGREKLNEIEAEYQKIGIVLSDQREFDIIKELRHARNTCVHKLNKPDAAYLKAYPKPRWSDDRGYVNIDRSKWDDLTGELERWTNDLVQRMTNNKRPPNKREAELK